jgi:F-type H+-transporting ATPase subunit gamma
MATLRDIRRKISSIQSTQTITRTVKMVSASKLRRAQEDYEKVRHYALRMEQVTERVVQRVSKEVHPLLVKREDIKNVLLVAIASDRGLCGGFNVNIGVRVENFIAQHKQEYGRIGTYVFGKKAKDYLTRRKVDIVKDVVEVKKIELSVVESMASDLMELYLSGEFDKVYLIYTHFQSPVKQVVVFEEFLPISKEGEAEGIDYIYEPESEKILEELIPKYVGTKIYYALADSQTSEQAARMAAMENATNNCGEMISHLTLIYNKRRQESITNEMMDIVGGAEALRGT